VNGKQKARLAAWVTVLGLCAGSPLAYAYENKTAASGDRVRWRVTDVEMTVDERFDRVVPEGARAIADAVSVWSGIAGGPTLTVRVDEVTARPGYDGRNYIFYAAEKFAPAGDALAVTVLSFDDLSGRILDADVVVNGEHAFALFEDGDRAPNGARFFAMDTGDEPSGTHGEKEDRPPPVFDLRHVTAHELGHVLGLADEPKVASALMYPFTYAHDASCLHPTEDDIAGIDALYSEGYGGGCQVGGPRAFFEGASTVSLFLPTFLGFLLTQRRIRRRSARCAVGFAVGALPLFAAGQVILPHRAPTHAAEVRVRIDRVSTVNDDGLFRSTLHGTPVRCDRAQCPAEIVLEVWGGRLDGIEQRVDGRRVPREGELFEVVLPLVRRNDASRSVAEDMMMSI
jgi:hypothetical protein